MRNPGNREMRALFSCMAWRPITSPLSKLKRRLDPVEGTQWAPREPRRDSRGERSPLLPLETRPDSPGESGMQPRDPCHPWREKLGMVSSPITSWQIEGEKVETMTGFIFLGSRIPEDGDCSHEIKRHVLLGRKAMTN